MPRLKSWPLFTGCVTLRMSLNPSVLHFPYLKLGLLIVLNSQGWCEDKWAVCVLSRVWFFVTSWTIALQAPLSIESSRQEYWSGFPFPSTGDLPDPRIKPLSLVSPALTGRFFTSWTTREAHREHLEWKTLQKCWLASLSGRWTALGWVETQYQGASLEQRDEWGPIFKM